MFSWQPPLVRYCTPRLNVGLHIISTPFPFFCNKEPRNKHETYSFLFSSSFARYTNYNQGVIDVISQDTLKPKPGPSSVQGMHSKSASARIPMGLSPTLCPRQRRASVSPPYACQCLAIRFLADAIDKRFEIFHLLTQTGYPGFLCSKDV